MIKIGLIGAGFMGACMPPVMRHCRNPVFSG